MCSTDASATDSHGQRLAELLLSTIWSWPDEPSQQRNGKSRKIHRTPFWPWQVQGWLLGYALSCWYIISIISTFNLKLPWCCGTVAQWLDRGPTSVSLDGGQHLWCFFCAPDNLKRFKKHGNTIIHYNRLYNNSGFDISFFGGCHMHSKIFWESYALDCACRCGALCTSHDEVAIPCLTTGVVLGKSPA